MTQRPGLVAVMVRDFDAAIVYRTMVPAIERVYVNA